VVVSFDQLKSEVSRRTLAEDSQTTRNKIGNHLHIVVDVVEVIWNEG